MKRKLTMLIVSMLAAVGLVFTASVPAQAFTGFATTPWACWSSVPYINVQNTSSSLVTAKLYNNVDNALIGTFNIFPGASTSIYAWTYKTIHVKFSGTGSLNWYYQQMCLS